MNQDIQKQLDLIEESKNWINAYGKGEKKSNSCRVLGEFRRSLKKKQFSLEGNPSAAIFGESQVGKSYLVSSLLSKPGARFNIIDGRGKRYDFINLINPIGNEVESTSIVTRFSTNYQFTNPDFPVRAKLFTLFDLILVLCDTYYNDLVISNDSAIRSTEINEKVEELCDRYQDKPKQVKALMEEDDVLEIKEYFERNFSQKAARVNDSIFFEKIPLLIAKSRPEDWIEIFELLWNNNKLISQIFSDLINQYKELEFVNEIYLPIEAVLLDYGTLLDVTRLHDIYNQKAGNEKSFQLNTSVLIHNHSEEKIINNFSKSYLCALTAELVFCLPKDLEESKGFLQNTDLLDFPGARHRLNKSEEKLERQEIPEMLLRGKVAYLFNKYSNSEKINILILCHNDRQSAQSVIPNMLSNWIEDMVGRNIEERANFISQSNVPPLFIVSTMFNKDLIFDLSNDRPDNSNYMVNRWEKRFVKVLRKEIIGSVSYNWFEQWTSTTTPFRNIFLLRDFYFSSDARNNIFKGYNEDSVELEEIIPTSYPEFRNDLRKSFLNFQFVLKHFNDPLESWEGAAIKNNDGTQLIINNLNIVSNNINPARLLKLKGDIKEISSKILDELSKYFYSNDSDMELKKAKTVAGNIQHLLDLGFSADGIKYYGKLMKELMLEEGAILELYRKKIDDIDHRDVINMDVYSTYRMQVPVLPDDTKETYFERMCLHYSKTTSEQKNQFLQELESKSIDLDKLINSENDLIKNNAQQLAEALLEYWINHVSLNDKHTIQYIFDSKNSNNFQDLIEMFTKLFKKTGISKRIAESIRRYIDGHTKTDLPFEIIADISAELLNNCIKTVGFVYLDEAEINDLKIANERNNLGLVLEKRTGITEKSLADLFAKIENWTDIIQSKPEEMKTMPSYQNYLLWYDRLKVGFIAVNNIPNYDITANEKLGKLINQFKQIKS